MSKSNTIFLNVALGVVVGGGGGGYLFPCSPAIDWLVPPVPKKLKI